MAPQNGPNNTHRPICIEPYGRNFKQSRRTVQNGLTGNAGCHEAGRIACKERSDNDLCDIFLTHWSDADECSQLHADGAEASDTTQHVCRYQHRTSL